MYDKRRCTSLNFVNLHAEFGIWANLQFVWATCLTITRNRLIRKPTDNMPNIILGCLEVRREYICVSFSVLESFTLFSNPLMAECGIQNQRKRMSVVTRATHFMCFAAGCIYVFVFQNPDPPKSWNSESVHNLTKERQHECVVMISLGIFPEENVASVHVSRKRTLH